MCRTFKGIPEGNGQPEFYRYIQPSAGSLVPQSFGVYIMGVLLDAFFFWLKFFQVRSGKSSTGRYAMETRIAVIAIIVEDRGRSEEINQLLHEYGEYIVGRMGVPYREKNLSIISVILDAPQEKISALSGKLGMVPGISSKTLYSKPLEKQS